MGPSSLIFEFLSAEGWLGKAPKPTDFAPIQVLSCLFPHWVTGLNGAIKKEHVHSKKGACTFKKQHRYVLKARRFL